MRVVVGKLPGMSKPRLQLLQHGPRLVMMILVGASRLLVCTAGTRELESHLWRTSATQPLNAVLICKQTYFLFKFNKIDSNL